MLLCTRKSSLQNLSRCSHPAQPIPQHRLPVERLLGLELTLAAWTNFTFSTKKTQTWFTLLQCKHSFMAFFYPPSSEFPSRSATEPHSASTLLRIARMVTHYLIGICPFFFLPAEHPYRCHRCVSARRKAVPSHSSAGDSVDSLPSEDYQNTMVQPSLFCKN